MSHMVARLAEEFSLQPVHVQNIIALLDADNTVPFIARYRKEMTGGCDDQVLRELADRLKYLRGMEKRRQEILETIEAQGHLTEELANAIAAAVTLAELEDLYLPFRPKRRTRALIAAEKGLTPLADAIWEHRNQENLSPLALAEPFVDEEKKVPYAESAVAGAMDILAERLSENAALRKQLREKTLQKAVLVSAAATEEDTVYRLYYEYSEPVQKMPGHRILAVNRGEREEKLKVSIAFPEEDCASILHRFANGKGAFAPFMEELRADAWTRLIKPSLEREVRNSLTERAENGAMEMFGLNLRQLLLAPPVKGKVVIGLDPAYRTGCKLCVVDPSGKVIAVDVIYPTPPQNKTKEAADKLLAWIEKYKVDCIAIGNGTASREAEIFTADTIKKAARPVSYMVVSEAGASVYSASKLAAEEFPDYDVSQRSAVSIARRLQDPLAELVKIEPKAIGVGQYQHDMPQARLEEVLAGVVESAVNSIGVDLNTASVSLLSYVAGISKSVAVNIVTYRDENGPFTNRIQLKKVKKLGPKTFEQCAGFLRIPGGEEPLDNTGVHPESYAAARALLTLFKKESEHNKAEHLPEWLHAYGSGKAAKQLEVGVPTLLDIAKELAKPGRDPRDELPPPLLRQDVMTMEDLVPGMELAGTVRNVIDFGAFVDIGVHQDGLVHISELSDRFVKHPSEVVSVGDIVNVRVLAVDVPKKRISLTMRKNPQQ
jgi:uncharacterized protein